MATTRPHQAARTGRQASSERPLPAASQQPERARNPARTKMSAPLAGWPTAALLVLAGSLLAAANYAPLQDQLQQQQQMQQMQQMQEAYGGPAAASTPAKAKKIQIVYIKVPLAKLKPAPPAAGELPAEHASAASAPKNFTASYNSAAGGYNSTGELKAQGSQTAGESAGPEQAPARAHHASSFLIPMAVISAAEPEQAPTSGASSSSESDSDSEVLVRTGRRSPALLPHSSAWGPTSAAPTTGFMSGFLQAEKERLTSAALRLHPAPSDTHLTTTAHHHHQQQQQQLNLNQLHNHRLTPGGLMPPIMAPFSHMPDNAIGQAYNAAVGQALPLESGSPNSILGSSSSASTSQQSYQQAHAGFEPSPRQVYGAHPNPGGELGTPGDSGFSPSTGSTGFYGSTGARPLDASSSAGGYQPSAYGSAGSAPSSGYGSGTNSFGASVAFTDFPGTLSGASSGYAPQHSSSSSSNSNLYNSHQSHPLNNAQGDAVEGAGGYGKLRQAKKTIIPIVVQVEHAIMESNALAQNLGKQANRYAGLRAPRGPFGGRQRGHRQQHAKQLNHNHQQLYGSASNEAPMGGGPEAQYINAANAQDVNQITAAINAENAASAAAALAQADMALNQGPHQYMQARPSHQQQQHQQVRPHHQLAPNHQLSNYASGLQSAASALLANTHPMLQAAASGGLASVTKLGAKLGEMMALPSMQMASGNPIAALPSAFSSLTNQMGAQLNQAVQQVAKEYPAGAFARQVAQLNQAGMQLAYGSLGGLLPQQQKQQHQANQYFGPQQQQQQQQQLLQAAGSQPSASILSSPQSHLQSLKLSIGQNLQSAAAQMLGPQKASVAQNAAATLLANPLSALYPPVVNSALKTMSGGLAMAASQSAAPSFALPANLEQQQQQLQQPLNQQQQVSQVNSLQQQQQQQQPLAGPESGLQSFAPDQQQQQQQVAGGQSKPAGKSLKSKFLSFFQPPKFISNLLNWNDHASSRNDDQASSQDATPAAAAAAAAAPEVSDKAPGAKEESVKAAAPVEQTAADSKQAAETAASGVAVAASSAATSVDASKPTADTKKE